jgi:protein gp37
VLKGVAVGSDTKIEWANHTWNPWYGCTPVSEGCANCYALRRMMQLKRVEGPGDIRRASEATWRFPLSKKVKAGDRVFVCSWGDFFHEDVPEDWRWEAFGMMDERPDVTFLLLTKRAEAMREWVEMIQGEWADSETSREKGWIAKHRHIWLAVTAENQPRADERITTLLSIDWPGKKGVSIEPMLGPVELVQAMGVGLCRECNGEEVISNPKHDLHPNQTGDLPEHDWCPVCTDAGERKVYGLDWIIAGGETGPNARPANPEWFRGIRDQCVAARVPFFFKQWGEWLPADHFMDARLTLDDAVIHGDADEPFRVGKKRAGRLLDGRTWNEVPG